MRALFFTHLLEWGADSLTPEAPDRHKLINGLQEELTFTLGAATRLGRQLDRQYPEQDLIALRLKHKERLEIGDEYI